MKTRFLALAVPLVVTFASYACSTGPDEPLTVAPSVSDPRPVPHAQVVVPAAALGLNGVVPGFEHAFTKSKFAPGLGARQVTTKDGAERIEGPSGAFVRFPNGFSAARPNRNSPLMNVAPLSADDAVHTARVLAYFNAAGLPQSQVGPTHVNTLMESGGMEGHGESYRKHVGYVTVIDRVIDGVRVAGSHAWAQFNADDAVVAEEVWWPDLPGSVKNDIATAKETLSVPEKAASFRARLPAADRDTEAEVVVHHAAPIGAGWSVSVSIDLQKRGDSAPRSYDVTGNPVNHWPAQAVPDDTK